MANGNEFWESFSSSPIGGSLMGAGEKIYNATSSFLSTADSTINRISNSGFGKVATAGYSYFMDQRKGINKAQVKGQRVTAPRSSSSGQALSAAQKADLGITPRVLAASKSAMNARANSAISQSISQLAYKRSRTPLINVGDTPQISVKPRAK